MRNDYFARCYAREQGLKRFHGDRCKKCDETLRYVDNGSCVTCKNSKARELWRYNHRCKKEYGEKLPPDNNGTLRLSNNTNNQFIIACKMELYRCRKAM